ncbi:MAG: hypothetical protein AAGA80_25890 [Cyanobacteria bacterium P01_F01_bin.143]
MGKKPNPWQKLVRGAIRDLINDVNSPQPKSSKPKKKKSKKVVKTKKRSRYIPIFANLIEVLAANLIFKSCF